MVLLAGLTIYGVLVASFGGPRELSGLFALRWPDTVLHGVTAVAGAVLGLTGWRQAPTPAGGGSSRRSAGR